MRKKRNNPESETPNRTTDLRKNEGAAFNKRDSWGKTNECSGRAWFRSWLECTSYQKGSSETFQESHTWTGSRLVSRNYYRFCEVWWGYEGYVGKCPHFRDLHWSMNRWNDVGLGFALKCLTTKCQGEETDAADLAHYRWLMNPGGGHP